MPAELNIYVFLGQICLLPALCDPGYWLTNKSVAGFTYKCATKPSKQGNTRRSRCMRILLPCLLSVSVADVYCKDFKEMAVKSNIMYPSASFQKSKMLSKVMRFS